MHVRRKEAKAFGTKKLIKGISSAGDTSLMGFMLLQKAVPEDKCHAVSELGTFFAEAFGNATRIDYGTAHELSFVLFLCGLYKAEVLVEADNVACALQLFHKYLLLVRRLQTTYRMVPAGSQGVWALDDFQFVPFIWGSASIVCRAVDYKQNFQLLITEFNTRLEQLEVSMCKVTIRSRIKARHLMKATAAT